MENRLINNDNVRFSKGRHLGWAGYVGDPLRQDLCCWWRKTIGCYCLGVARFLSERVCYVHIADTFRKKAGYPKAVAAYCFPPPAAKVLPKWIAHVSSPTEVSALRKPHIIIIDESIFHVNSRRSQSGENLDFTKLLGIIRHKDHLLIFVSQTSRQVDIQVIEGFDLVLIKAPSLLQVRSARAELRPEIEDAYNLFTSMRGDTRTKVYMFDPHKGGTGMQTASMPTWWTARVSKAYSAVVI